MPYFPPIGPGGGGNGIKGLAIAVATIPGSVGTSWVSVSDLVVFDGDAGDLIEVSVAGLWGSGSTTGRMDLRTKKAGTPVNYASGSPTDGWIAWVGLPDLAPIAGAAWMVLQAGDIALDGTVSLEVVVRSDGSRNIGTTLASIFRNYGPAT